MKKFKLDRKYYFLLAVLIFIASFVFWRQQSNKPEYDSYTVESRPISSTLELAGEVQAEKSATLRFGAGGLITYMGAKEGDKVAKWQTLASVDTRLLSKVLEQKLNLYAIQRDTFDQTVDDNDNSVPAGDLSRTLKRVLEKNQYQLENSVKDVEYQDLTIKLSRIYSPIAGILIHSPITVSNVQVSPTDTWQVVDPNTLEFVADLDESELKTVHAGQKVIITLDAFRDREIESTITSISFAPKETSTGTTYEVKITLPPSVMSDLRLGLNGNAAVILEEKASVPTLPSSAINMTGGKSTVKVKNGDDYRDREIETGIENNGYVEILSGVTSGETVYQVK